MRALAATLLVCACVPLPPPCDRVKAALAATSDPTLQEYLRQIPVEYVAGMPVCDGVTLDSGNHIAHAQGCFYGDHITIGTVDWNRSSPWLYEDEICAVLAHELRHALQQAMTCHTWHAKDVQ